MKVSKAKQIWFYCL